MHNMGNNRKKMFFFIFLYFVTQISTAPMDSEQSLIVSSTEKTSEEDAQKQNDAPEVLLPPQIYQMHVFSNISNRFSHTTVTSKVKNSAVKAQEAVFSVILPETAFVSSFIMEVNGINYTAHVKEKEEAKQDYEQAVAGGLAAAHVAVSTRDSNRFTVSVNVEPETKAAFYLSYEQLLKRKDGRYEQVINLHPGQPIEDLNVEVHINEGRKIIDLKTPPFRSGNEIGKDDAELDPRAEWKTIDENPVIVKFTPNESRQKQLAKLLGAKEEEGISGQFVVQYDVERDPQGGEVLIQDGYFVHFFAPTSLAPLPKHVIFVLDTSGSMYGQKIEQLKEAMHKILEQLNSNDLFNLVEFNTNVKVWDLYDPNANVWYPISKVSDPCIWVLQTHNSYEEAELNLYNFPKAYPVNDDNIKKAKDTVSKFEADGGTDIYSALKVGLHLAEMAKNQISDGVHRQPMIVFLTDGDPTIRVTSTNEITKKITAFNVEERKSPIFALSFGSGADKIFLQKIALQNFGFSKHIYEAADASLQLQDFYKQISSPLLSNVTFKYEDPSISLTNVDFPIHFDGSEIVVAGWCGSIIDPGFAPNISRLCSSEAPTVDPGFSPEFVYGWNGYKIVTFKPTIRRSVTSIERLWAYLTVQQLLEKKEISDENVEEVTKKALDLSLKYSFVTPVSSLVVVKPNATSAVNTEAADSEQYLVDHIVGGQYPPGIPLAGIPGNAVASLAGMAVPTYLPTMRPIPLTTPFCPPYRIPTSTTKPPKLSDIYPWISAISQKDGQIVLPTGNYTIETSDAVDESKSCPKTPTGSSGQCKLLRTCNQVYSSITSVEVYLEYMCEVKDGLAGVCCSDN